MNIDRQQDLAGLLLNVFKLIDPAAMIAGGAPRDWYFGKEARDIDIYFRAGNYSEEELTETLEGFGITELKLIPRTTTEGTNYAELPGLLKVFGGNYCGLELNIMLMEKGCYWEIVKDFDTSICQCWWNGVTFTYSKAFKDTIESFVIMLHPKYNGREAHVRKIAKRFPDFRFAKEVFIVPISETNDNIPSLNFPDDIPW